MNAGNIGCTIYPNLNIFMVDNIFYILPCSVYSLMLIVT